MKEIVLSNGMIANVNDEDYGHLSVFRWRALRSRTGWYAVRNAPRPERTTIYMHRVILRAAPKVQVDHIDGNGLNNRRSNLRLASDCQNKWNRDKPKSNTSGYKGVFRRDERWAAYIKHNKRRYYLGAYSDPVDAARAYDRKARELHGDFAKTNF